MNFVNSFAVVFTVWGDLLTLFWGVHTQLQLGITPMSVFINHSWKAQRTMKDARDWTGLAGYKENTLPAVLSLWLWLPLIKYKLYFTLSYYNQRVIIQCHNFQDKNATILKIHSELNSGLINSANAINSQFVKDTLANIYSTNEKIVLLSHSNHTNWCKKHFIMNTDIIPTCATRYLSITLNKNFEKFKVTLLN